MYLPAGQIYRVEVCDSEEVTEMQRRSKAAATRYVVIELISP